MDKKLDELTKAHEKAMWKVYGLEIRDKDVTDKPKYETAVALEKELKDEVEKYKLQLACNSLVDQGVSLSESELTAYATMLQKMRNL